MSSLAVGVFCRDADVCSPVFFILVTQGGIIAALFQNQSKRISWLI